MTTTMVRHTQFFISIVLFNPIRVIHAHSCRLIIAGMNENPADHLDAAAFQPSHTLSFEIAAGSVFEFFEDVKEEDVGKVCV